jgi:peptidoglycan/LPS O-acetylase OafA/YrhL
MYAIAFIRKKWSDSFTPKNIPGLDGLRALCSLYVILAHFNHLIIPWLVNNFGLTNGFMLAPIVVNFQTAICCFFVLSGFVTTRTLITAYERDGKIDYLKFVLNRAFRIFPAYYFYLFCAVMFLIQSEMDKFSAQDLFSALTLTYNYFSDTNPWLMNHFWSLSFEVQFYLLLPVVFLIFDLKRCSIFPYFVILISPFLRLLVFFQVPEWRNRIEIITPLNLDIMMFGYLLNHYHRNNKFPQLNTVIKKYKLQYVSTAHLLIFSRLMHSFFPWTYMISVGYTLDCLFISVLIVFVIENLTILRTFLDSSFMVHLGTISFSIYLWQMPLTWFKFGSEYIVLRVFLIYVFALGSYLLIEAPFMELRKKRFGLDLIFAR